MNINDIKKLQDEYFKTNKPTYTSMDKEEIQEITKIIINNPDKLKQDLNFIDVSHITDMSFLFENLKDFNCKLDKWDVSNTKDMCYMFYNCENFNQPLNDWNVFNVNDMFYMFFKCEKFNQPLNNWDVFNVKDMNSMFKNCKSYSYDIDWNTPFVKDIESMFENIPNSFVMNLKGIKNKIKISGLFQNSSVLPTGEFLDFLIKHYNDSIFENNKIIKTKDDLIKLKKLNLNEIKKVIKIINILNKI